MEELIKELPKMNSVASKIIEVLEKENIKSKAHLYSIIAIVLKRRKYKEKADFKFIEAVYEGLEENPK